MHASWRTRDTQIKSLSLTDILSKSAPNSAKICEIDNKYHQGCKFLFTFLNRFGQL